MHIMAVVQLRHDTPGPRLLPATPGGGQDPPMEAIRALERRLSDVVYRQMISDAKHVTVAGDGSGRTLGSDSAIQRGQAHPDS